MTPNIPALVAELRELEAKATNAPWEYQNSNSVRRIGRGGYDGSVMRGTIYHGVGDIAMRDEDGEFTAKLRNTIPTLLDIIEQQGREIESLRRKLQATRGDEMSAPDGYVKVEAWTNDKEIVVLGEPPHEETDPECRNHHCDDNGCSAFGPHVIARITHPFAALKGAGQ